MGGLFESLDVLIYSNSLSPSVPTKDDQGVSCPYKLIECVLRDTVCSERQDLPLLAPTLRY